MILFFYRVSVTDINIPSGIKKWKMNDYSDNVNLTGLKKPEPKTRIWILSEILPVGMG